MISVYFTPREHTATLLACLQETPRQLATYFLALRLVILNAVYKFSKKIEILKLFLACQVNLTLSEKAPITLLKTRIAVLVPVILLTI